MKHRVAITPLNCNYGTGLNDIVVCETAEYDAKTTRAIYIKDPCLSWFKMKAGTTIPYLEPAFFGIKPGDIFNLEFDLLQLSGTSIDEFIITFRAINSDGTVGTTTYTCSTYAGSLKSHFTHYKIPFIIPSDLVGDGIILNVRHLTAATEVIVKNFEVEIETSNNNFSMVDQRVEYATKADFLDAINIVNRTNLSTAYASSKTILDSGLITFPDANTMSIATGATGSFQGLIALMSTCKYYQPYALYIEYKNNASAQLKVAVRELDNTRTFINTEASDVLPLSATYRKDMYYFLGRPGDKRSVLMAIGRSDVNIVSDIKRVVFCLPRFDDQIKREPNKLSELYTDLGDTLNA